MTLGAYAKLGIYAPYRRDETTTASLRLADLAASLFFDVRLLSCDRIERGIHPAWDERVSRYRSDTELYQWAKGCDHFVWFCPDAPALDKTRTVAEKAQHVLVLSWHHLNAAQLTQCRAYSTTVCPSVQIRDHAAIEIFKGSVDHKVLVCNWDSGLATIERRGKCHPQKTRLLVHMDATAIDDCGQMVLMALGNLLSCMPRLEVTLFSQKTWSRAARKALKILYQAWHPRLTMTCRLNLVEQVNQLHNHDWCLIPSTRVDFGMPALRALSCGLPVMAFDLPPLGEFLSTRTNAALIGCDLAVSWLKAPIAFTSLGQMLKPLVAALGEDDDAQLHKLQLCDWKLAQRATVFREFWTRQWGLELS